jgi:hypothetical protein
MAQGSSRGGEGEGIIWMRREGGGGVLCRMLANVESILHCREYIRRPRASMLQHLRVLACSVCVIAAAAAFVRAYQQARSSKESKGK